MVRLMLRQTISSRMHGVRPAGVARVCAVLVLGALLAGCWPGASAVTPAQPPRKDPNVIPVTIDQMHQLKIVEVELFPFRLHKQAIGQIAFNEDASTVVQTPFSGRVTRVLAKIGDDVRRGDPLFEIDSPEVVQAQTDLIAALHGLEKARSQLNAAQRQAEQATVWTEREPMPFERRNVKAGLEQDGRPEIRTALMAVKRVVG